MKPEPTKLNTDQLFDLMSGEMVEAAKPGAPQQQALRNAVNNSQRTR